jgi:DNA-binding transcriptional LysR family regulator
VNLREIQCFLAVANGLHFGRAAERLHLAQPTVSESIRRLERELGGQLFDRTTRNVSLTELGVLFRRDVQAAYEGLQLAYAAGRDKAQRHNLQLVIGAANGDEWVVVAAIAAIAKAHPELAVDFVEMNTLQQVDALVDGRLDVGLAWMPPAHEAIASAVTARVGYVALLPVAHPLAARSVVSAAALADEPLITWPRAMNPLLYERFEAALNATGRPWSLVATASGFPNIVARVMSGHGIGVIPASAASARPLRGMAVVPLGEGGPLADRAIIWRQRAGEAGYAASS